MLNPLGEALETRYGLEPQPMILGHGPGIWKAD